LSTGLRLALACPDYDRTEALRTREVRPDGIDLVYLSMLPAEAHARMIRDQEFDASDMSISHYIASKVSGKASFTAIPVFPMRRFFHTDLIVNSSSGIHTPEDLRGKKIGVQEYGMTLALWIRGILQHEFGVASSEIGWYLERMPEDRVGGSLDFKLPAGVRTYQVPRDSDLLTMLQLGELDAAFPYPRIWKTKRDRTSEIDEPDKVRRLFHNPKEEAIRYYEKTGFFPINHLIVVKDEILKENPWVALSLFEAFQKAKEVSYAKVKAKLREPTNYVWLDDLVEEVRKVFGDDPYPYGIRRNEKTIDAMTQYSWEQGLSPRKAAVSDLFFPTTLDL
jgi:4,5-dihydroxyphthalate decarboxylase